jgi:hypothetical protein
MKQSIALLQLLNKKNKIAMALAMAGYQVIESVVNGVEVSRVIVPNYVQPKVATNGR